MNKQLFNYQNGISHQKQGRWPLPPSEYIGWQKWIAADNTTMRNYAKRNCLYRILEYVLGWAGLEYWEHNLISAARKIFDFGNTARKIHYLQICSLFSSVQTTELSAGNQYFQTMFYLLYNIYYLTLITYSQKLHKIVNVYLSCTYLL